MMFYFLFDRMTMNTFKSTFKYLINSVTIETYYWLFFPLHCGWITLDRQQHQWRLKYCFSLEQLLRLSFDSINLQLFFQNSRIIVCAFLKIYYLYDIYSNIIKLYLLHKQIHHILSPEINGFNYLNTTMIFSQFFLFFLKSLIHSFCFI